jgi:hypothetical protein
MRYILMNCVGVDLSLMETVYSVLEKAGLPTNVETGKTLWREQAITLKDQSKED